MVSTATAGYPAPVSRLTPGIATEFRTRGTTTRSFNVIGEVLPAVHVERVRRDYCSGRRAHLEECQLRTVDEDSSAPSVDAMTQPMQVREEPPRYGGERA